MDSFGPIILVFLNVFLSFVFFRRIQSKAIGCLISMVSSSVLWLVIGFLLTEKRGELMMWLPLAVGYALVISSVVSGSTMALLTLFQVYLTNDKEKSNLN